MNAISEDLRRSARFAFDKADDHRLQKTCKAILDANPQDVDARRLLGLAALRDARPDLAETWFRETAARRPDSPAAWRDLARALVELRREAEAEALLAAAVARGVRTAGLLVVLGQVRERLDRTADAIAAFEAAIELDPGRGEAYWGLAKLGGLTPGDPVFVQAEERLATGGFTDAARVPARFALAEACRQAGDYEGFLARAKAANADLRAQTPRAQRDGARDLWRAGERARFAAARRAKELETRAANEAGDLVPIFLIAEPRGGAEVAEAVLTNEPGVFAGGALNFIAGPVAKVIERHTGRRFPDGVENLKPNAIAEARAAYFERAKRLAPNARRIVDRSAELAPLAGVLRLLFPEAPIVRLERNAFDQALDLYRTYAPNRPAAATDLAQLGRWLRNARRAAEQAERAFDDAVAVIDVDALAASPATEENTLREAAGLAVSLTTFSSPRVRAALRAVAPTPEALKQACERPLRPLKRALKEYGKEASRA